MKINLYYGKSYTEDKSIMLTIIDPMTFGVLPFCIKTFGVERDKLSFKRSTFARKGIREFVKEHSEDYLLTAYSNYEDNGVLNNIKKDWSKVKADFIECLNGVIKSYSNNADINDFLSVEDFTKEFNELNNKIGMAIDGRALKASVEQVVPVETNKMLIGLSKNVLDTVVAYCIEDSDVFQNRIIKNRCYMIHESDDDSIIVTDNYGKKGRFAKKRFIIGAVKEL